MKEIKITSQKEWDALPSKFDEYTRINIYVGHLVIRSTPLNSRAVLWDNSSAVLYNNSSAVLCNNSSAELWGNSRAELWDNSRAELWGNSRAVLWDNSSAVLYNNSSAELWGNSRAELWDNSRAELYERSICYKMSYDSSLVSYDNATIYDYNNNENITREETVNYINKSNFITPTFEQWLERGWVVVDGISRKLIDKKTINNVTIYKVSDSSKEISYVVQNGDKFAHGETIEKAKDDLKYKISNRDKSKYKNWKLDDIKSLEEMIEAYRVITGACELGVKDFCNSRKMKEEYSVKEVIEITKGSYGSEEFGRFFK